MTEMRGERIVNQEGRITMSEIKHPVDDIPPPARLVPLALQHVLVMYAGAIAVPLILGRALGFAPDQVAYLVSADLFACGIVSIIQSLGVSPLFGIRLPMMMGVSFTALGPMVTIAVSHPGVEGARIIFGAAIGAGIIAMLLAPVMARVLRFFPPIVTGTIILIIGITLMRIGINWVFGLPFGPTAPRVVDPQYSAWLKSVADLAGTAGSNVPAPPAGLKLAPSVPNPLYADGTRIAISAFVLIVILATTRLATGFIRNIAVLIGIIAGAVLTALLGMMHFGYVANARWFDVVTPFYFGTPIFNLVPIATMTLVIVVLMIESIGLFLALEDMTGKKITQRSLTAGLRTDGLGAVIGGVFNTFPYSSFSQNVGLVGITGVSSRFVCVAAGVIMLLFGLVPKIGALVQALPDAVLGGAGVVMFGMVAAAGVRVLSGVDFKTNRFNPYIVAVSLGIGMIPTAAPDFHIWVPRVLYPMIDSGILLGSVSAVVLNMIFNPTRAVAGDVRAGSTAGYEIS
jgi:NCS2 family nucleobase:cation symporter-2